MKVTKLQKILKPFEKISKQLEVYAEECLSNIDKNNSHKESLENQIEIIEDDNTTLQEEHTVALMTRDNISKFIGRNV